MASPAVEKVLVAVQHLSDTELQELAELLEDERTTRIDKKGAPDPLLALASGWAAMGDEAIDAFDAEIQRSRSQAGREVILGE